MVRPVLPVTSMQFTGETLRMAKEEDEQDRHSLWAGLSLGFKERCFVCAELEHWGLVPKCQSVKPQPSLPPQPHKAWRLLLGMKIRRQPLPTTHCLHATTRVEAAQSEGCRALIRVWCGLAGGFEDLSDVV